MSYTYTDDRRPSFSTLSSYVHILTMTVPGEGSTIIGVYSTEEKAYAACGKKIAFSRVPADAKFEVNRLKIDQDAAEAQREALFNRYKETVRPGDVRRT